MRYWYIGKQQAAVTVVWCFGHVINKAQNSLTEYMNTQSYRHFVGQMIHAAERITSQAGQIYCKLYNRSIYVDQTIN